MEIFEFKNGSLMTRTQPATPVLPNATGDTSFIGEKCRLINISLRSIEIEHNGKFYILQMNQFADDWSKYIHPELEENK